MDRLMEWFQNQSIIQVIQPKTYYLKLENGSPLDMPKLRPKKGSAYKQEKIVLMTKNDDGKRKKKRTPPSLWSRATKNSDTSTGPLTRPFTRSLPGLLCLIRSRAALCSFACSLTHSQARGKVRTSGCFEP